MKQNIHHLYYLYYPRNWIIIVVLICTATTLAQELTPPQEFIVGSSASANLIDYQLMRDNLQAIGLNTMSFRADENTPSILNNYNLLAWNMNSELEYIYHYSSSYYSKWEAEQNQTNPARVGVKHTTGDTATWKGALCWSTKNYTYIPDELLMSGPHYWQDKTYKRLYPSVWRQDPIEYNVRFNMALDTSGSVQGNEDVCRIKVVYKYKEVVTGIFHTETFLDQTLKVQDFRSDESFDLFNFEGVPYQYDEQFILPNNVDKLIDPPAGTITFTDIESYTGIQYVVDWLRNDDDCTLYIDYVEVYDNKGWNDFIEDPVLTANKIKDYADSFSGWDNIMYLGGVDEPSTLDSYTPFKTVNSILIDSAEAPPLMCFFNPSWTHNHLINGEMQMKQYIDIAKPYEFLLAMNPGSPDEPVLSFAQLDWLRYNFQLADSIHPNFWYAAQTHGLKTSKNGNWCVWRKPDPPELSAIVMLALAHGAEGIIFMWFDSYVQDQNNGSCFGTYWEAIVDEEGYPLNTYCIIKDNLVPRLKGTLGKTLMKLDYTGNFLQLRYSIPTQPQPISYDYLTLGLGQPADVMNWHCGFFIDSSAIDDKYFHLTNLITTEGKNIHVKIQAPNINPHDPLNYRFRNVEGLFDTTIQAPHYLIKQLNYPPGEGYLYEFAPVIKYGGRLLYSESTQPGMILNDDMIIENGALLTVNGVYSSKGNITIKSGGIINGDNGKIQFVEGKKLIIEGSGSITGTANNKLHLTFSAPINDYPTGIEIKSGGSLTITNCIVESATIGINSLLNANYLNAQNVNFINCETHSISIAGRSSGMLPTPPPLIKNCIMLNSDYGIAITNLPGMLIQDNIITNTDCGIYLSNVTDAQVINNFIQSNRFEMAGIYFQSSYGFIRANSISGHSVGLHLANASPELGSNGMTLNKYHGLYIGSNSVPFMRAGKFIGRPPNFYATSGYNKIYENGGYEGEGDDNDGSEIYFVDNSNAEMDKGCNRIYDDREPSPPLINTLLLMSSPKSIEVDARMNYWGNWVDERRFENLIVEYIPYSETPCPEPQNDDDELVRMTSFGEVIDTVYAVDIDIPEMTETEADYAEAEEDFLIGDLTSARQIYEGIINSTATEEEKYIAYERKYSIGKLTGESTEFFNQLSNTFSELASNTQDTLNKKILNQLSTLSKVGEQEYETAISEFDNIVQQNPNTEEAVYAEIDALTTAILIEEADTTLQKGRLGKYLIKSSANYHQRVDEILRKNFGRKAKENAEELLPTEYTLYQNYPNPFNPTTTIKYDLPTTSDVSLIIYDILGRKVQELVNTRQQAGRYEIQFDASNLSSGVYIYQLIAEKYISSRKMILLK